MFHESISTGRDRPPHRHGPGNLFDLGGECLERDQAIEAHLHQGIEDLTPLHVPACWRAAIVLTGVKLKQPVASQPDGFGYVLLFDVHVECVQEQAHVVASDLLA